MKSISTRRETTMKLRNLFARVFDFLAWRSAESIAYDEVFGAPGDTPPASAPSRPPLRAADADAYFKDVFAGSAL
jgi:hypothetical protein